MPKNIVLCIDGTGNEFGENNSNVVKLYSTLNCDGCNQIAFYHPGLGTMGSPYALSKLSQWWTKVSGLAFGYGLSAALEDCYTFLIENYEEKDSIYIFGFSRGAYCARALAAMIHMYGLVQKGNEPLIRYILKMFKKKQRVSEDFRIADKFKRTFSRSIKIHFVGVWDTVSSVGWIYDPVTLPFTSMNPDIEVGRHAVSIDERRSAFRQNLWTPDPKRQQNIKQMWFAGVHSDIGGGYPESESGLAKIALGWMLEEAEACGLRVDEAKKNDILGITNPKMCKANCLAKLHRSLTGWWWLLEFFPRQYYNHNVNPPTKYWKLPFSTPRYMAVDTLIHPTVAQRETGDGTYRPVNLPKGSRLEPIPIETKRPA